MTGVFSKSSFTILHVLTLICCTVKHPIIKGILLSLQAKRIKPAPNRWNYYICTLYVSCYYVIRIQNVFYSMTAIRFLNHPIRMRFFPVCYSNNGACIDFLECVLVCVWLSHHTHHIIQKLWDSRRGRQPHGCIIGAHNDSGLALRSHGLLLVFITLFFLSHANISVWCRRQYETMTFSINQRCFDVFQHQPLRRYH